MEKIIEGYSFDAGSDETSFMGNILGDPWSFMHEQMLNKMSPHPEPSMKPAEWARGKNRSIKSKSQCQKSSNKFHIKRIRTNSVMQPSSPVAKKIKQPSEAKGKQQSHNREQQPLQRRESHKNLKPNPQEPKQAVVQRIEITEPRKKLFLPRQLNKFEMLSKQEKLFSRGFFYRDDRADHLIRLKRTNSRFPVIKLKIKSRGQQNVNPKKQELGKLMVVGNSEIKRAE